MSAQKLGFVGGGQMASALAGAFVESGRCRGDQVHVFDPAEESRTRFLEKVPGAKPSDSNHSLCEAADLLFLAVKPQVMPAVLAELDGQVMADQLVISIAAGITLRQLTSALKTERVVRVMPNTPCLVGRGACGFSLGNGTTAEDAETVETLLTSVGVAFAVTESQLDAVTGLSGSGPAYIYTLIEALSDGGVRMGLPRQIATQLATQTVRGAAEMVSESDLHPAVLREQVTSPGGTTIAGLQALEEGGFRAALMAAVEAATHRSQELANS